MKMRKSLSGWDVAYSVDLTIACFISYSSMTYALSGVVDSGSDYLGGMWAAVATIFVFRDTREGSLAAGTARFIATCVSFALCLPYLWFFPFTPLGMAILIGIGTVLMMVLDRRGDIATTGITTAVVMVVAAMHGEQAWLQPVLRFLDTIVGIAVGVGVKWVGSFLYYRYAAKAVQ
jgi:uncharacterized membrane protein YccC